MAKPRRPTSKARQHLLEKKKVVPCIFKTLPLREIQFFLTSQNAEQLLFIRLTGYFLAPAALKRGGTLTNPTNVVCLSIINMDFLQDTALTASSLIRSTVPRFLHSFYGFPDDVADPFFGERGAFHVRRGPSFVGKLSCFFKRHECFGLNLKRCKRYELCYL